MPYLYTNTAPPHTAIIMNTPETAAPFTPETLPVKVSILSRRIDWSDKKNIQFKFTLQLECEGRTMETPYSGGILAFIEWDSPKVKKALNIAKTMKIHGRSSLADDVALVRSGRKSRRSLADESEYLEAVKWIFEQSTVFSASVCHSLILDGQCGEDTFADFCANCGYDEDSRSALATYEACQKSGAAFRKLVGSHHAAIAEALRDY